MPNFRAQLKALGYAPADWQLPVTEEHVAEFERDYAWPLPAEYRAFLLECGGWTGSATCALIEQPTPLGSGVWIDLFYGRMVPKYEVYDLRWATDAVGAPGFVAVADGGMNGCTVVMRCGGADDGYVYFLDVEQRSLWPDEEYRRMFPALAPEIAGYLDRRRAGQLPPKPEGYESLYLLARGFSEFVARLEPARLDDE